MVLFSTLRIHRNRSRSRRFGRCYPASGVDDPMLERPLSHRINPNRPQPGQAAIAPEAAIRASSRLFPITVHGANNRELALRGVIWGFRYLGLAYKCQRHTPLRSWVFETQVAWMKPTKRHSRLRICQVGGRLSGLTLSNMRLGPMLSTDRPKPRCSDAI